MQEKYKEFIVALVLVLICPAVIAASLIGHKPEHDIVEASENSAIITDVSVTEADNLQVLSPDGSILNMKLDDYLTCVLLCEMPISFEEEALKAQAVVARTYTLRRRDAAGKHPEAPVCMDSSCCQGYVSMELYCSQGGTMEEIEKARRAVQDTAGKVLVYDDQLIDATYFSCSGGMTEDALAVWGADIPYLQSKISPGEEIAQHYVDTERFTVEQFKKMLNLENTDPVVSVGNIKYTKGGGVASVEICGKVLEGTQIRKLLGLRSTAFVINVIGNHVSVTTKGFGHRVGMSQYGAEAMAVQGKSYEDILLYYYDGVEVKTYIGD